MQETKQEQKEIKHLVRIANTDLEGHKLLYIALRKIKGINFMFSHSICVTTAIDPNRKVGYLTEEEIKKIDDVIKDPAKFGIPVWMFNRRRDCEDGSMRHLVTADLSFTQENDIKMMRKIKSYKGVRHSLGLPARGQRTKSNFRRNKGKVHLGVKKKEGVKSGRP